MKESGWSGIENWQHPAYLRFHSPSGPIMPLTNFTVVHASSHDVDGTVIHCFDGEEMVIAIVPRAVLDDYFNWPSTPNDRRPSLEDCHLVVDRNIAAIGHVIEGKYRVGDYGFIDRSQSTLKRIEITAADVHSGSIELTDSVLRLDLHWGNAVKAN